MLTSGDGGSGTLGFREVWWTFSIAWISGTLGTVSHAFFSLHVQKVFLKTKVETQ